MDTAQILADLRAERSLIDRAIVALEAFNGTNPLRKSTAAGDVARTGQKVRRTMSAAARKKIAAAQKARWAVGIPVKVNAVSGGKPNGIPERR